MSWEQLKAIRDAARQDAAGEDSEPPSTCPNCGTLLQVRPDGVRHCPFGDYTSDG